MCSTWGRMQLLPNSAVVSSGHLITFYALEFSWLSVWFWMQFKVLILNVKYFAF